MRTFTGAVKSGGYWTGCGLAALGILPSAAAAGATNSPPSMFIPSENPVLCTGTPELRSRSVVPEMGVLLAAATPGGEVTFNLFEEFAPVGRVGAVHTEEEFRVISGALAEEPESSFLLVMGPTTLTGEVRSPRHGVYEVRHTPRHVHVVRQINEAGFLPCATGPEHVIDSGGKKGAGGVPRGVPEIRVMVVFTPLARADEGGEEAIRGRVVFAINQANIAYQDSQAVAHLTLAYTGVIEYTESNGANTDIVRLRQPTDGFMDGVHCIRDIVRADLVSLLVNNFNACGIGYLQSNPGPGFAPLAFSVTDKDCIANFSFAHELGHNMGCHHDRDNGSGAAFPYAYGYRTPDDTYRTIMAYAPGTRVGRFSNPNITYQGYVMGIPLGQPGETYNALCITNTAAGTAAFRSGEGVYADFNLDGMVNSQDFFDFLGVFFVQGSESDFNHDRQINSQDFFDFLSAFFAAC